MAKQNVLQEGDERLESIESTLSKTEEWIEKNRRAISIVVIAIIAVVLVVLGIIYILRELFLWGLLNEKEEKIKEMAIKNKQNEETKTPNLSISLIYLQSNYKRVNLTIMRLSCLSKS